MPDYTRAFREEVVRLTRKAMRAELAGVKKNGAQHRRDIARLKREVAALQRRVALLSKGQGRRAAAVEVEDSGETQVRYSARWLKTHRGKVGLSAVDYGRLVGVSGQTVYLWEQGKTKPRRAQLLKIAAIRSLGKREAARQLEMLDR